MREIFISSTMGYKNIQQAITKLKRDERRSILEMARDTGMSYGGLKKILDGETKNVQEATLRMISDAYDRDIVEEDGEIHFVKKTEPVEVGVLTENENGGRDSELHGLREEVLRGMSEEDLLYYKKNLKLLRLLPLIDPKKAEQIIEVLLNLDISGDSKDNK